MKDIFKIVRIFGSSFEIIDILIKNQYVFKIPNVLI